MLVVCIGLPSLETLESTQISNTKHLSICVFAHLPKQYAECQESDVCGPRSGAASVLRLCPWEAREQVGIQEAKSWSMKEVKRAKA